MWAGIKSAASTAKLWGETGGLAFYNSVMGNPNMSNLAIRSARGMLGGAAAGGVYGAASNDTSVVGGAMMGAGAGLLGGRYGMTAYRGFNRGRAGGSLWKGVRGAYGTVAGSMRRDFKSARNLGETIYESFGGTINRAGRKSTLASNAGVNPMPTGVGKSSSKAIEDTFVNRTNAAQNIKGGMTNSEIRRRYLDGM